MLDTIVSLRSSRHAREGLVWGQHEATVSGEPRGCVTSCAWWARLPSRTTWHPRCFRREDQPDASASWGCSRRSRTSRRGPMSSPRGRASRSRKLRPCDPERPPPLTQPDLRPSAMAPFDEVARARVIEHGAAQGARRRSGLRWGGAAYLRCHRQ